MDGSDAPSENVLELTAPPASRVWAALCVAAGAALFTSAIMLATAELVLSLKSPLLEAVAPPGSP